MTNHDSVDPAWGHTLRRGAVLGAVAWVVYAVAETVFSSLVPWIAKPGYAYSPVHRGFTLLLFGLYPVLGAIAGALCAAALRMLSGVLRHDAPVAGALSLVIAFDLNLLHIIVLSPYSFESSVMHLVVPAALSLVPIAALLASRTSAAAAERLRFLANPWTAAFFLTGIPWTTLQLLSDKTTALKVAGGVGYAVLILVLAAVVFRAVRSWKTAAVLPVAVLLTLAATMQADHTPHIAGDPPPVPDDADGHPNVILIVLDTTRANRLSLYGYERPTSPNLETFAEGATVYTRAVSSGDMTLTTHGTLFTGLYGRQHGAHRSETTPAGRPLASRFVTVAEMLLAESYWTAAVVGNRGYVTPHFGFDQGFLYFDSRGPVPLFGHVPAYYIRRGIRAALVPFAPRSTFDRVTRHAAAINKEAFDVLDRA
ncbi:MAG: sulfatase-like hydrolase/transferase, partial [Gemmatimonadetes bacterium]|nr:sulfatase-like hydrolase/transferase [Gemmatimonadota bacterium]